MTREELEKRTERFALDIMALVKNLRRVKSSDVVGYQLLRSGTSNCELVTIANMA